MRNRYGRLREKINCVDRRLNYVEKRLREKRGGLREKKNYEKKRLRDKINYAEKRSREKRKRLREKINCVKKKQNNVDGRLNSVDGRLIEKRDRGENWLKMRDDRRKCNNRLSCLHRDSVSLIARRPEIEPRRQDAIVPF